MPWMHFEEEFGQLLKWGQNTENKSFKLAQFCNLNDIFYKIDWNVLRLKALKKFFMLVFKYLNA